jgi:hypothetical protein
LFDPGKFWTNPVSVHFDPAESGHKYVRFASIFQSSGISRFVLLRY